MKKFLFSYHTVVTYEKMVRHHSFLLRAIPMDNSMQRVVSHQINLLSPAILNYGVDSLGNKIQYGSHIQEHDIFVVAATGLVECEKYGIEEANPCFFYKVPTKLTLSDYNLSNFGKELSDEKSSHLEQTLKLSTHIFNYMSYSSNTTSVKTTASETFNMRNGVCQDFAHILLALCRDRDITARYVVGFVAGTGETHAWVEVWSDGKWYGVDPTHNLLIEYGYIKVAHGRDANDCSVIRGIHKGDPLHSMQVRVSLNELV